MSLLRVRVADVQQITPLIKQFTLVAADGTELPSFSGGSHIVVAMNVEGRIHRNPYSLMSAPEDRHAYKIAVRLQEKSRGGSVHMHTAVNVGAVLDITYPVNLFALDRRARKHILIAGGVGITPFMSQIADLQRMAANYELHYAYRAHKHGAFTEFIKSTSADQAHFYVENEGGVLDIRALLAKQPLGTHVYVCGPNSMVVSVLATARDLGWPDRHIHSEQFAAPPAGEPFRLKLAKSNIELVVPAELSMLEAIEAAGVDAPYLCRGGACGRCELDVISNDGVIMHHDHYLSDAEKAAGKKIMPCVSRARCDLLELNI